jgi:hypothetical protein
LLASSEVKKAPESISSERWRIVASTLLRKVGGGYMFIHRMLLEWFAERYEDQGASSQKEAPSRSTKLG